MRLVRSDVVGLILKDRDGRRVGTVVDFHDYPAERSDYWGVAEVAPLHRFLHFGRARRAVDLTNAQLHGSAVLTAHAMATIRCAPRVSVEQALTLHQADVLITHYWPAPGSAGGDRV
jgi:hypothetical protein